MDLVAMLSTDVLPYMLTVYTQAAACYCPPSPTCPKLPLLLPTSPALPLTLGRSLSDGEESQQKTGESPADVSVSHTSCNGNKLSGSSPKFGERGEVTSDCGTISKFSLTNTNSILILGPFKKWFQANRKGLLLLNFPLHQYL